MPSTYEGTLTGDRIAWKRERPPSETPLHVQVTVIGDKGEKEERGRRMAEALTRLAESGAYGDIKDPAQWQREVREERRLPWRE